MNCEKYKKIFNNIPYYYDQDEKNHIVKHVKKI